MKTKINLICVLIFGTILFYFTSGIVMNIHDFVWGFELGSEHARKEAKGEELDEYLWLDVVPKVPGNVPDSVFNQYTQQWTPMMNRNIVVQVPSKEVKASFKIWQLLSSFLQLGFLIAGVWIFIKLIISINKGLIFEWGNIRKLRWLGFFLVIGFLLSASVSYSYQLIGKELLKLEHYRYGSPQLNDIPMLLMGLVILLLAEIFAYGLKLREDQDLTI